nr:hypothetical protein [Tanacetum cinerariifolium]
IATDLDASCALGFLLHSLEIQSLAYGNPVHIEVLSVLYGNRLPIPDGSLSLSSNDNRFGSGHGNGNRGAGSSRQKRGYYNYGEEDHMADLGVIVKTAMIRKMT